MRYKLERACLEMPFHSSLVDCAWNTEAGRAFHVSVVCTRNVKKKVPASLLDVTAAILYF